MWHKVRSFFWSPHPKAYKNSGKKGKNMNKTYLKVVECAIEHDSKFLVIKRPQGVHAGGMLAFPGGKLMKAMSTMRGIFYGLPQKEKSWKKLA
jgi:hypothetical protein